MEKWICKVCGYTHQGDEAPEICPRCGAPKSKFHQENNTKWYAYGIVLIIILLIAFATTALSCCSSLTVDNSTVETLDLNKYLGKWYEIARFDHRFERGMEECTATYSIKGNGKLKITNMGLKDGKWKTSEGKGKITDTPGVLQVSFFGPFYSDYRVLMLAPDYSYSLVGGDGDDYLWILSRTPHLEKSVCARILREARRRGYDTDKLIWVKQSERK